MAQTTCLVQQVLRGARVSSALRAAVKGGHVACVCDAQCQLEKLCYQENDHRLVSTLIANRSSESTLKRIQQWATPRRYHTSGLLGSSERVKLNGQRKTEVSYEELSELLRDGSIILVDVREPHELEEYGEIPGAVNIPLKIIPTALAVDGEKFMELFGFKKPAADAPLVFHCLGGVRSYQALIVARDQGYEKSVHYKGGWEDWSSKTGQPLKKEAKV